MKVSTKLTSIKIIDNLYKDFKSNVVNTSMTLQRLVNRSVYLYLEDAEFKMTLENSIKLNSISGSGF